MGGGGGGAPAFGWGILFANLSMFSQGKGGGV